jgi:hypothetical protein
MAAARDEGLEIVMPDKSLWCETYLISDGLDGIQTSSCYIGV